MFGPYALPSAMEPLHPPGGQALQDLGLSLIEKAGALSGKLHPQVARAVSDLVRSMNCYYSNLIEGHNTHPRDIERALQERYSTQIQKRNLQLEAKAHIEVQKKIDEGEHESPVVSTRFLLWVHDEFCRNLPDEMLWVENPDSNQKIHATPGKFREGFVQVGQLIPPASEHLTSFLKRFEEAYSPDKLSRLDQIFAVAASHHRLLWIHPFYDGNGRVARLFSHAFLKRIGLGCNGLWSIARGLARSVEEYRAALMAADHPRLGDMDGRGNLSEQGIKTFCEYFLRVCIDQVDFMSSLLQPTELKNRIELYSREEVAAKRLPRRADALLGHVLLAGELPRGKAASITGYQDRQARTVLNQLMKDRLLTSDTPKGPVRLGFPVKVLERWFPKLYPIT